MFDRRLILHFDWVLLLTVMLLVATGILNLYSATAGWGLAGMPLYLKQLTWFGLGLAVALALCLFDYRHLAYFSRFGYGLAVLLLLFVLLAGKTSMGATRWISLGPMNLQPSEVMKIMLILMLARYYSETAHTQGFMLREMWLPALLVLLPMALVMKQPDLGTAMMILLIAASLTLFAGLQRASLVKLALLGMAAASGGWFLLHDYQRQRIHTFLDPERDPLGSGYHIIQSKIAVGSGGFFGKGFMQGTQSQLSFLPERHTDFVFSVFAEEWGFVGCLVLLVLYLFLIIWGLYVARQSADRFGMFLAIGVTAMLFWHIVVNLAMVIGLMPVVGVPLPLFSYGGTSMLTTMIGVGLLLNVSSRRYIF